MTNWGTFTPSGLEILIGCSVWWKGDQQREEREDLNPCSLCTLCATVIVLMLGLIQPTISSGEHWHDITQVRSFWVIYIYLFTAWVPTSFNKAGLYNTTQRECHPNKKGQCIKNSSVEKRMGHTLRRKRRSVRYQSVNTEESVNDRGEENECVRGEKDEKPTACAMWVKLTPMFPGGWSPCCLWLHGLSTWGAGGDGKQSW